MQLSIDWGDPPGDTLLLDDDTQHVTRPTTLVDLLTWAQGLQQLTFGVGNASELQHTYSAPGTYTVAVTLTYFQQPGDVPVSVSQQLTVHVTQDAVITRALGVGTAVRSYAFGDPDLVQHAVPVVAALTPF